MTITHVKSISTAPRVGMSSGNIVQPQISLLVQDRVQKPEWGLAFGDTGIIEQGDDCRESGGRSAGSSDGVCITSPEDTELRSLCCDVREGTSIGVVESFVEILGDSLEPRADVRFLPWLAGPLYVWSTSSHKK